MGGLVSTFVYHKGADAFDGLPWNAKSVFELGATKIDGEKVNNLGQISEGKKAILVVNVASE